MRYDDGQSVYNLEATAAGSGGWGAFDDAYFIAMENLPRKALACGFDLRAVTPREMLGLFIGLRARYLENTYCFDEAERDYLQARALFPSNRQLHFQQLQLSLQQGADYFEPGERSHPSETAAWLLEVCRAKGWSVPRGASRPGPRSTGGVSLSMSTPKRIAIEEAFGQIDVLPGK